MNEITQLQRDEIQAECEEMVRDGMDYAAAYERAEENFNQRSAEFYGHKKPNPCVCGNCDGTDCCKPFC